MSFVFCHIRTRRRDDHCLSVFFESLKHSLGCSLSHFSQLVTKSTLCLFLMFSICFPFQLQIFFLGELIPNSLLDLIFISVFYLKTPHSSFLFTPIYFFSFVASIPILTKIFGFLYGQM